MSFKVKFNVDGSFVGNVRANENMEFKELINLFLKNNNNYNEYHKAIFSFHSKKINRNLEKQIKELGIKANSVIEVRNKNLLNSSNNNENMGNYKIPQNFYTFMGMNMYNNGYNMFQNINNNSNINMYPFMMPGFMNMGQIMNYYGNMYMYMNKKDCFHQNTDCINNEEDINIIFIYHGQRINIQGFENDRFCDIATKFSKRAFSDKYFISETPHFISNSRLIYNTETKTLKDLGIYNHSRLETIFVSEVIFT